MKKIKCEICGYKFLAKKENVYRTQEESVVGNLLANRYIWDTIDCPECGVQNILRIRTPKYKENKR